LKEKKIPGTKECTSICMWAYSALLIGMQLPKDLAFHLSYYMWVDIGRLRLIESDSIEWQNKVCFYTNQLASKFCC